jgi:predicted NAD-dependent protein-ADP-ribosyltransferase YbiA (DUF1768 family)
VDISLEVFPSIDQMAETEKVVEPAAQAAAAQAKPAAAQAQAKPAAAPPAAQALTEFPPDPYDKKAANAMKTFFRNRSKNQEKFTFTADGNLAIADPAGTIQLKRFLPLEPSERAALEELRLNTLAELELAYEAERIVLATAWESYYSTGAMRPVIAANQRVAELDARRNAMRSAVREIMPVVNPAVNEILLSNRYEERKMFGQKSAFGKLKERQRAFGQDPLEYKSEEPFDRELYRMAFYEFKPEHDQGKYVADESADAVEEQGKAEAAAGEPSELTYRQSLKDGRKARIFFDTDSTVNGFLSPMWPVEFTMDETAYFTALQAYEVERAKELGLTDLQASLLKTRSARTIRLMTRKVTQHPADAKGLWLKIFTQIYQQTEALKVKLLATGTDALVFADVREGPSGIGLAEKDSGVLDPNKWRGENAVGLAQETVRTRLREGELEEAPVNATPNNSVITEEEQEKAKVGAIIANARRSKGPG